MCPLHRGWDVWSGTMYLLRIMNSTSCGSGTSELSHAFPSGGSLWLGMLCRVLGSFLIVNRGQLPFIWSYFQWSRLTAFINALTLLWFPPAPYKINKMPQIHTKLGNSLWTVLHVRVRDAERGTAQIPEQSTLPLLGAAPPCSSALHHFRCLM